LRALIACWALLAVFEPSRAAGTAWELRTQSAWLLPGGARPAAPLSARASCRADLSWAGRAPSAASGRGATGARARRGCAERVAAQRAAARKISASHLVARSAGARGRSAPTALSVQARGAPGVDATLPPRLDGRHLYLELQSLLC